VDFVNFAFEADRGCSLMIRCDY